MSFEEIDILDLIPQRPPFLLIDRLVDFDERYTVTRFTVRENHLFCEQGELQAAGLIENIARPAPHAWDISTSSMPNA